MVKYAWVQVGSEHRLEVDLSQVRFAPIGHGHLSPQLRKEAAHVRREQPQHVEVQVRVLHLHARVRELAGLARPQAELELVCGDVHPLGKLAANLVLLRLHRRDLQANLLGELRVQRDRLRLGAPEGDLLPIELHLDVAFPPCVDLGQACRLARRLQREQLGREREAGDLQGRLVGQRQLESAEPLHVLVPGTPLGALLLEGRAAQRHGLARRRRPRDELHHLARWKEELDLLFAHHKERVSHHRRRHAQLRDLVQRERLARLHAAVCGCDGLVQHGPLGNGLVRLDPRKALLNALAQLVVVLRIAVDLVGEQADALLRAVVCERVEDEEQLGLHRNGARRRALLKRDAASNVVGAVMAILIQPVEEVRSLDAARVVGALDLSAAGPRAAFAGLPAARPRHAVWVHGARAVRRHVHPRVRAAAVHVGHVAARLELRALGVVGHRAEGRVDVGLLGRSQPLYRYEHMGMRHRVEGRGLLRIRVEVEEQRRLKALWPRPVAVAAAEGTSGGAPRPVRPGRRRPRVPPPVNPPSWDGTDQSGLARRVGRAVRAAGRYRRSCGPSASARRRPPLSSEGSRGLKKARRSPVGTRGNMGPHTPAHGSCSLQHLGLQPPAPRVAGGDAAHRPCGDAARPRGDPRLAVPPLPERRLGGGPAAVLLLPGAQVGAGGASELALGLP
eukprot:scaffold23137_cov66-Phaeocystis_antarctica.AAC.4